MISGTITLELHLAAMQLHARKWNLWAQIFCVGVLLAGMVMSFAGADDLGAPLLGVGIGGLIGAWAIMYVLRPWRVRRLHAQQKALRLPITFFWDIEFLEGRNASTQTRMPWRDFIRVRENETLFLLYHSDNLFQIVPKAWFFGEAQIDEFRRLALGAGHGAMAP